MPLAANTLYNQFHFIPPRVYIYILYTT